MEFCLSKRFCTTFIDKTKKLNLNNYVRTLARDLFVCGLVIKKEDLAKLSGINDSKKLT